MLEREMGQFSYVGFLFLILSLRSDIAVSKGIRDLEFADIDTLFHNNRDGLIQTGTS